MLIAACGDENHRAQNAAGLYDWRARINGTDAPLVTIEPPRQVPAPPLVAVRIPGAVWMAASAALFTAMLAVFKLIGSTVPVPEILFLRQLMVLVVVLPAVVAGLPGSLATLRSAAPGLQVARSVLSGAAMLAGFVAVVHLPLTQTTTLAFTRIIFAVLLSAVLLREQVGRRRWGAVAVGFVGVLVTAAPSPDGSWSAYILLSLVAALLAACVTVILRRLATRDGPQTIMLWHSVILLALLAVPAWAGWTWPAPRQWELIAAMGLLMAATQWTSIRALQVSEASAMAPIEYTRLIWAALFGWMLFDHIPSPTVAAGAVFVLMAVALAR